MKRINNLPKRRKREGKTNYKKRLKLLLSRKPRLVIRSSNSNIIVQIIDYGDQGDNTLVSAHSKELTKMGWTFSKSNTPAAYLTGLLAGKKAKEKGIKEVIVDIGLKSPVKGSRIFAALKGFADMGVSVPFSDNIMPSDERIEGKHIADYKKSDITKVFKEIKTKVES